MNAYVKGVTVTLAALVLAACGTPSSSEAPLTMITIAGANDVTVDFDTSFNLKTGVTAIGNNNVNYTDQITLSTISTAVNLTTGVLDTTRTGTHTVQYRVQVGSIVAIKFRNISVSQPASTGGMLINPDFALGTAGWDDPGVVFNQGGSSITFDVEAGALKVVVVSSGVAYAPRFGQMNVPFEKDVTYAVSFRAKSSVEKPINLNVGELISSDPWFIDFKPRQTEIRTIGTEWATFSYTFTHRLDNKRGGLLFELGTVSGQTVNATMHFDDIVIEETTAGPDVTAPVFSGVKTSVDVEVGATFNPLTGVTAYDVGDGDVTADIMVKILNSSDVVVNVVDTTAAGVFTVEYSVEDTAGNKATAETTVNVVEFLPPPQWIGYGGFNVDQSANNVTIAYTNVPTEWWTDNAQLPVVGFDGSQTSVKFVYTGVSGHTYLFKIEGGGISKEVESIGTGASQEVIVPLSEFTSAQRAGLNLIIVFVKTSGSSGSMVVNNWTY